MQHRADRVTVAPRPHRGADATGDRLEVVVIALACFVAFVGGIGVALAWIGWFRGWLVLLLGAAACVVAARAMACSTGVRDAAGWRRTALVIVPFALYGALTAIAPSQHLYVDRDPAVYNHTAAWIASTGSLRIDLADVETVPGGELGWPGTYRASDSLEFQFAHLPAAFLAVVIDVTGTSVMWRTSAFVTAAGLLAVYAVARRVIGRPDVALLAPAVLAATMPVLASARDTYSEPYAMLMIWAGACALFRAWEHPARTAPAVIGGVLVGAVSLARLDGLLYLALAASVVIVARGASPANARMVRVALTAMAVTFAFGVVDLAAFSTGYVQQHTTQLRALVAVSAVLVVSGSVGSRALTSDRAGSWVRRNRFRLARWITVVLAASAATLWFVRPLVQTVRSSGGVYLVEDLQFAEGLGVDGARLYSEETMARLAWYLGPVGLTVALVAWLRGVHLAITARANAALAVVASALTVTGAVVLWNPSISPDHVWSMRRFVPAVLPALCVLAAAAVGWAFAAGARHRRVAHAVTALGAALVVGAPLAATWPVRMQREQYGLHRVLDETCDVFGGDSVAMVVGEEAVRRIALPIRAWCGVPVVGWTRFDDAEGVRILDRQLRAEDKQLAIVARGTDDVAFLGMHVSESWTSTVAVNERQLEKTIGRRPDRYTTEQFQFFVYRLAP